MPRTVCVSRQRPDVTGTRVQGREARIPSGSSDDDQDASYTAANEFHPRAARVFRSLVREYRRSKRVACKRYAVH